MTTTEIYNILIEYDNVFDPPLHTRILEFDLYAKKLLDNGYVYIISNEKDILGFVAFYANDTSSKIGYLTQIAVSRDCTIKGIGYKLLKQFEKVSYECNMKTLMLEVNNNNTHAIEFYKRNGYEFFEKSNENSIYMVKHLL